MSLFVPAAFATVVSPAELQAAVVRATIESANARHLNRAALISDTSLCYDGPRIPSCSPLTSQSARTAAEIRWGFWWHSKDALRQR
jgi:hypothetical protein